MIARAIKEGWDVPKEKREQIQRQMEAALKSEKPRLIMAVARLAMAMVEANSRDPSPPN